MYVCICNRYRDSDLRHLAAGGTRSAEEAYSVLGNGPQCGRCLQFAQALMDEVGASPEAKSATA
jgi:bacterioferritin-associated ferredoxin